MKFDLNYFKSNYTQKNIFGLEKGERPFLYSFWMRKFSKMVKKGAKILEVGCGVGYFLRWLEKKYDVVGVDISSQAIKIAKNRTKASLLVADAQKLPFRNETFDVIVAFDVIEHLENPVKFFREAYRVLSRNGLLILSTPNPGSFGCYIKAQKPKQNGLLDEKRVLQWHGYKDNSHISIKSIIEWRNLLKNNNFLILKDGTDTLWDVPYFRYVPTSIQKFLFISIHWVLIWLFGFFNWKYGENYICIAQKVN